MKIYKNPSNKTIRLPCQRPQLEHKQLSQVIKEVFGTVAENGDQALVSYTRKFDEVNLETVYLTQNDIKRRGVMVPVELRSAIDMAYGNIKSFHEAQRGDINREAIETIPGVVCWREARAIERVGLYVPGGTAPLVSTVLMLGVPAQIAGCKEVVLCTPPSPEGTVNPGICYAALKIGATKLFRVGGAQAIAALSIGTETVPKVDKIFGPGNQYVMAAKQYAVKYGVAIDMPAGPSEVMVIADKSANPAFVAADLLSQAEHGADSQVALITSEVLIARQVNKELIVQMASLPRNGIVQKSLENSFCVVVKNVSAVMEFANVYAAEHLILSVKNPALLAKQVLNAGSVFLGDYSPESAGDYASGTNHTLPTGGWARSYGGVSLDSFVKKVTFQSLSKAGLRRLSPTIESLAEAEGLEAHKRAVTIRLK